MTNNRWQAQYTAPNDLNKVCSTIYEFAILHYMIQLNNGYQSIHPSIQTLCQGYMSRPTADEAIDGLVAKGFIQRIKHQLPKANEYIIECEAINRAIRHVMDGKELSKLAGKELKESQLDAMSVRRVMLKPELQNKVSNLINLNKDDK